MCLLSTSPGSARPGSWPRLLLILRWALRTATVRAQVTHCVCSAASLGLVFSSVKQRKAVMGPRHRPGDRESIEACARGLAAHRTGFTTVCHVITTAESKGRLLALILRVCSRPRGPGTCWGSSRTMRPGAPGSSSPPRGHHSSAPAGNLSNTRLPPQ